MITKETDRGGEVLVWGALSGMCTALASNPDTAKKKKKKWKANLRKSNISHPLKHLKLQDGTNINF